MHSKLIIQILLAVNALIFLAIFCVEKQVQYVPCKHVEITCKPEHLDGAKKVVELQKRIEEVEAFRKVYDDIWEKLIKEKEQVEGDVGWFEALEMCSFGDQQMCDFISQEREIKLEKQKKIR